MIRGKKNQLSGILLGILSVLYITTPTFAHVIVYPRKVGIAETQVFDMSVPTEKDNPTIGMRLLIPIGVQEVIPNAKPGWTIHVVKKEDSVVEIDWTNGSIPPQERDDFYFQAQVPPTPITLHWKAYQTYQDGSIVAWDHTPTVNPEDDSAPPPYSTTQVINDIANRTPMPNENTSKLPLLLSIVALALSAASIGMSLRQKK